MKHHDGFFTAVHGISIYYQCWLPEKEPKVVLLRAMTRFCADMGRITLPILLLQGGADRIVDPAGARMFYDRAGSEDKTIKIYSDCYHELFNEPEHARVLDDVQTWLDEHL